jgi:hypothetical protein
MVILLSRRRGPFIIFLIANKFWINFAKPSKDPKPDNIAK